MAGILVYLELGLGPLAGPRLGGEERSRQSSPATHLLSPWGGDGVQVLMHPASFCNLILLAKITLPLLLKACSRACSCCHHWQSLKRGVPTPAHRPAPPHPEPRGVQGSPMLGNTRCNPLEPCPVTDPWGKKKKSPLHGYCACSELDSSREGNLKTVRAATAAKLPNARGEREGAPSKTPARPRRACSGDPARIRARYHLAGSALLPPPGQCPALHFQGWRPGCRGRGDYLSLLPFSPSRESLSDFWGGTESLLVGFCVGFRIEV